MAAAIPHALLLLHALLDILPYPQGEKGMWYEIKTGTTECVDEVMSKEKGKAKAKSEAAEGDGDVSMEGANEAEIDFSNIGAVEEDEPERVSRLKVSLLLLLAPLSTEVDRSGIHRDRSTYRAKTPATARDRAR
jgi:hypothetical protein